MKRSHSPTIFSLILIVGDVIAILAAYSIAYIIRVKISDIPAANFVPARSYFLSLLALLPFIVLLFSFLGSYQTNRRRQRSLQIVRILLGALGAMLFLVTLDYFYYEPLFPAKLVPLYGFLLSIGFLAIIRGTLYILRRLWWRKDERLARVIVVGDNQSARDIAGDILHKQSRYKLQAVIGDRRLNFTTHKDFYDAVHDTTPDIIIQVASKKSPHVDNGLLDYALSHYCEFKFVPSDINELPDHIETELFMAKIPMLNVQPTALVGWGRVAKRLLDLATSGIALLLLSPLLIVIALINRIVFGKVIFGQTRLTRGDRPFTVYKFQTVANDLNGLTPEEAFQKIGRPELSKQYRDNGDFLDNDPRYGRWSRFLRSTSLDELPQFWNVFRGDISLVGPRALIPEELENYSEKHRILNVKSGLTGLAQISGRKSLPWEQRRRLDVYYAQNWTFGLDIQIILSTAWQVLTGRGAK